MVIRIFVCRKFAEKYAEKCEEKNWRGMCRKCVVMCLAHGSSCVSRMIVCVRFYMRCCVWVCMSCCVCVFVRVYRLCLFVSARVCLNMCGCVCVKSLRLPCLAGSRGWSHVFASCRKALLRRATCSPCVGGTLQIVTCAGFGLQYWMVFGCSLRNRFPDCRA